MKSEPFRFSPTSAGVRIDHLNLHTNKYTPDNNNNKSTFSLPRPRVALPVPISSPSITSQEEDERQCLERVLVQKPKTVRIRTERPGKKRKCITMRNCIIGAGVVVIACLLSFILFVECRSVKGVKKHQETEPESRIQDDTSSQEPDPESSEENPVKVYATSTSPKTNTKWSSNGRLTGSRVSVICKGGVPEEVTESSTRTRRVNHKDVDLPTLLPRETDGDEEDNDWDDDEATLGSEEVPVKVVTVTGYSQVTGGKPETKSHSRSGVTTIKYVPKSSPATLKPDIKASIGDDSEEVSGEETVIITVKPKSKSGQHSTSRPKLKVQTSPVPGSQDGHSIVSSSSSSTHSETSAPNTSSTSKSSRKKDKHRQRQSKRESEETESEEEEIISERHESSKHSSKKSSRRSKQGRSKDTSTTTSTTTEKNEKGDSGELDEGDEEDSLFPTLPPRKSKSEGRRSGTRKSEKKSSKTTPSPPTSEEELESAEAEPAPVIEVKRVESSSRKSSRSSRKSSSGSSRATGKDKEASSSKPVSVNEDDYYSSEEYKMEEMPFGDQSDSSGNRKSKSRSSSSSTTSSSSSSSSRNARMSSKTKAPKLRTRPFSSLENENAD